MDKIHWISIQMYYIIAILVLKSCDYVSFKLMMMIETRLQGLWCEFERCCLTGCLTGGVSLVRLLCCAVSLVLVLVVSHWWLQPLRSVYPTSASYVACLRFLVHQNIITL